MLILLQAPEQASRLGTVLDIVDKVTKILAVIIGGAWAYLNYVRGRTYKKRLETNVSGEWFESKGLSFLSGSAHLKNVGLSKFPIEQKGTAILVYDLQPSITSQPAADLVETLINVRSIFKTHAWIEPNETIEESFVIQLGSSEKRVGIKLALRVVAAHIEWNANRIIVPAPLQALPADSSQKPGTQNSVDTGGAMSEREGKSENTFPGKPGSTNPVNTQIIERPDITDQIERQKDTILNDEGSKTTERFD
jgi:hypothetical protein